MPKIGAPRTRIIKTGLCPTCNTAFNYLANKSYVRTYCSNSCHMEFERNRRRKMPSPKEVARLYCEEGLSTVQIAHKFGAKSHQAARRLLVMLGIERIKKNRNIKCRVDGCDKSVFRIYHKRFNCWFGTMCHYHRKLHYAYLNRMIARKNRKIPPLSWRYETEALKFATEDEKCLIQARQLLERIKSRLQKARPA